MRLSLTDKRPCRLARGEVRRVPQMQTSRLIGYHVCCPRCGFVTIALQGDDGLQIDELAAGDQILLSLSRPIRCLYCCVVIRIDRGDAELHEDDQFRPIPYR